ncbi:phosphoserine phosphatase SerB [Lacibacter cauensis]|uniref:Phosphoserine phosphatase SerB n=1 Tax=Lacibacter cauensis TaxID=510947 RepID=A0A562SG13_9BACT|nr:HAD-IB family phosphatase [Lacibacter cauensis]TWI80279.1 phosphoserine phosphatase SerB [Lacibacter cauensis]
MVTVIIPVLNEAETIASVVKFAFANKHVTEVIVVDDKSFDDTVSIATAAGAKVITSTKLGKGASMKEGMLCASNDILIFLDGDINPYPPNTICNLTDPIINDTHDFVKATFERNAGRVTELVAKPLLNILFPDLSEFEQPLSGMIAGRKKFFEQIDFYDDYGVDIGILIDMYLQKARITEVNIGYIDNKSKPWQALGKMSKEVSRAIIQKAMQQNKPNATLEELQSFSEIRDQMEFAIRESLKGLDKIAIFDMDGTILRGRFIDTCARLYGFEKELLNIRAAGADTASTTKNIAKLLKGLDLSQVLAVADGIPLVHDAKDVVTELKKRGYVVGIISDSYDVVTNHIKTKIGADFSLANELEFSKSVATGEVKLPSFFFNHTESICKHAMCKTNAVQHILKHYNIDINNAIAVGDGENDLCMIKHVGVGVSFCSSNELLNYLADRQITTPGFQEILEFA